MKRTAACALAILLSAGTQAFAAGGAEAAKSVSYMTWYSQGEESSLLAKYTKETGVQVKVEVVDGSKYEEVLKLRMTAGDLPDVITCKQNLVELLMRGGFALDVTGEPATALLDRAPAVKAALTYQGKIYSIPQEGGVGYGHMYYNKLLFRKAGLPVPFNPATIDELESALAALSAAGIEPVLFGAKDAWVTGYFALRYFESEMYGTLAGMNGGKLIEPNEAYYKGIAKPSDGLSFAFHTLERWRDKGWISKNSLSMTWPESFAYFASGKAAVFPQGFWVPGMDEAKKADPAVFDLGVFYMPQKSVDGKQYASGYVDKMLMVNAKSKNLAAAKAMFNWLGSEQNLAFYLAERKAASFILPIAGLQPQPIFADYTRALQALKPIVVLTTFPSVPGDEHTNLGQFTQAVLSGESADQALKDLDAFYAEHKPDIKVPER